MSEHTILLSAAGGMCTLKFLGILVDFQALFQEQTREECHYIY